MKKVICVEERRENSRHVHFNRAGDWRPRFIIWPEYDGKVKDLREEAGLGELDDETDAAWGRILFPTLQELGQWVGYAWREPSFFARLLGRETRWDPIPSQQSLSANYINARQHSGHEQNIFLCRGSEDVGTLPNYFHGQSPDRATLLPLGKAILALGTEEAVAELCFDNDHSVFWETLRKNAERLGHHVETVERHFISHWVLANKKSFGENIEQF